MLDVMPGRGVMLSGRSEQVRVLENFSVVWLSLMSIVPDVYYDLLELWFGFLNSREKFEVEFCG